MNPFYFEEIDNWTDRMIGNSLSSSFLRLSESYQGNIFSIDFLLIRNLKLTFVIKKNSATALWDKNLKFPSTQVCPLLFPFLCQTFYVIRCHFVSFYATQKNQGIKRVIQNSWLSTGSWYLDLIPMEVLWAKIFMFQYTLLSPVFKVIGKNRLVSFCF